MPKPFIKLKRFAQIAGNGGWNKHVGTYMRQKANKVIRRIMRAEQREWD